MSEGRTFSPVVIGLMIAAGVFAFATFAVLSAYAPELRRGNDGREHALSKSAVGFAGAVRLLEAQGVPVRVNRRVRGPGEVGLLVLTPTLETDADEIEDRIDDARSPVLVVLPKWDVEADPRRQGWVRREGLVPEGAIAGWSTSWLPTRAFQRVRRATSEAPVVLVTTLRGTAVTPAGRIDALQTLQGPTAAFEPLLSASGGAVLGRVRSRDADLFLLSDPDLLNTQGLAELETAQAAMAILADVRTGNGAVVFDVTLHGFGQGRSLIKLAFAPPFLAVTLCAAAAAALAAWQAAVRFGPHRRAGRAFALGKQALADNAAALITQSGREPRMARRYATLVQARAAAAVAAPAGDEAETAAWLDRLGRTTPEAPRLSALLAQAQEVSGRAQLLDVARRLHQWRREIARES